MYTPVFLKLGIKKGYPLVNGYPFQKDFRMSIS